MSYTIIHALAYIHGESKMSHYTLAPNFVKCRHIFKIFSLTHCSKFANIPPHLKHVATLPYEISMFRKLP